MKDVALTAALVFSSALWLTVHAALALGLVRQLKPRWQALWLIVPACVWLAPYWGFRNNLRFRSTLWCVSLAVYLATLALTLRST